MGVGAENMEMGHQWETLSRKEEEGRQKISSPSFIEEVYYTHAFFQNFGVIWPRNLSFGHN